jgi:hypothetical protein
MLYPLSYEGWPAGSWIRLTAESTAKTPARSGGHASDRSSSGYVATMRTRPHLA